MESKDKSPVVLAAETAFKKKLEEALWAADIEIFGDVGNELPNGETHWTGVVVGYCDCSGEPDSVPAGRYIVSIDCPWLIIENKAPKGLIMAADGEVLGMDEYIRQIEAGDRTE